MKLAPIALFVYKRPEHTRRLLESLTANNLAAKSDLWVFCEGIRDEKDRAVIEATRAVVKSQQWCGNMHIFEREKNLGCAASIIEGIEAMLVDHDRIIVLEDDLILSPYFLTYMNEALERYADASRIMQISGYMFPVELQTKSDTVFLPFICSWGWATWRRAWTEFDPNMQSLPWLDRWRWRKFRFDLYGAFPYRNMITQQLNGQIDAWDIRWYLSVFRKHGLTIYPKYTLVENEGFSDGTHQGNARFKANIITNFRVKHWSKSIHLDSQALLKLGDFFIPHRDKLRVRIGQLLWK